MVDPISIPQAARALELSPSRVQAMVASQQMPAVKVGGRWLIERGAVERRRREGVLKGRPFAAHNAWALLLMASGENPRGLDPSVRSRLRRALAQEGLEKLGSRLVRRADSRYFEAHSGELPYVLRDPAFVASGISAAAAHGLDLASGAEADGYLRAGSIEKFAADHALRPANPGANVRLRLVPDPAWASPRGISDCTHRRSRARSGRGRRSPLPEIGRAAVRDLQPS